MRRLVTIAILAVMSAAPAAAQTSADVALAAGIAKKEKVVCTREQPLGSRLGGRKVCRTETETRDVREQTRQKMDQTQRFYTNGG